MRPALSSSSYTDVTSQVFPPSRLTGTGYNYTTASVHASPASRIHSRTQYANDTQPVHSHSNSHRAGTKAAHTSSCHTKQNVESSRNSSIPHLREALNSLESQMASLRTQKHILESRLEQAVRLQSPVQRLPSELLGSIFAIGVLQMEEEDSVLLSTLMLVCKDWTEVALSTPVLWSRITVGNHDSLVKARRKLSRSKSVPLDICIQFNPRMESTAKVTELVIHAMDILKPSIWRWRSFRLSVPNRPQAHAALSQCRESAPLLEHLSIQIFHVMQDDLYSNPPLPLFQGYFPRLRSTSFTSFNFGWDPSLTTSLRVLKLGGYWHSYSPSIATLVGILRACPALEEIAFRNMSDTDEDSCVNRVAMDSYGRHSPVLTGLSLSETSLIALPRLKKASFYYAGITRVHTIFSQLSFPALEQIEFAYLDNITPILGQLKRQSLTSLPLRHLRIESCFVNELKLMKLLKRLNSLHTLELVDVEDVSANLLKGLSSPPVSQSWVCPKLEVLNLDGCTALDWDSLRHFVESRLPSNASRMLGSTSAASYPHDIAKSSSSSASAYARVQRPPSSTTNIRPYSVGPRRLKALDLTRCHQISKEMLQWLKMYVAEVRCESTKTYWGEGGFD